MPLLHRGDPNGNAWCDRAPPAKKLLPRTSSRPVDVGVGRSTMAAHDGVGIIRRPPRRSDSTVFKPQQQRTRSDPIGGGGGGGRRTARRLKSTRSDPQKARGAHRPSPSPQQRDCPCTSTSGQLAGSSRQVEDTKDVVRAATSFERFGAPPTHPPTAELTTAEISQMIGALKARFLPGAGSGYTPAKPTGLVPVNFNDLAEGFGSLRSLNSVKEDMAGKVAAIDKARTPHPTSPSCTAWCLYSNTPLCAVHCGPDGPCCSSPAGRHRGHRGCGRLCADTRCQRVRLGRAGRVGSSRGRDEQG